MREQNAYGLVVLYSKLCLWLPTKVLEKRANAAAHPRFILVIHLGQKEVKKEQVPFYNQVV